MWAVMCRRSGDDEDDVRRATEIIPRLGYMKFVFKPDQKQSLTEADRIIKHNLQTIRESIAHLVNLGAAAQVVVTHSAIGESASNCRIEIAFNRSRTKSEPSVWTWRRT